jgi:hypothetical protein
MAPSYPATSPARRPPDVRLRSELARGGRFAVFGQPGTFVDEARTFFRLVR